MDHPGVAKGESRSPSQSALPEHAQDMYSFQKSSLSVPAYSNPASGAQYNTDGGPQAPYQMPIMSARQPSQHGHEVPFVKKSDGAPVERK